MKILFTGSGSGGHFYPLIAVAEAIHDIVREKKLIEPELYYMAPEPYDPELLFQNEITFIQTRAGKMRHYFSVLNVVDAFKTGWGVMWSLWHIFFLYPDVVFGSGGYGSFPTLFAARILRIPVVIYATDAVPSRVNRWAARFATKIAISFPEAASYFPPEKVALTGNPIRKNLLNPTREGALEFLHLTTDLPIILVLGGSQGSTTINDAILAALPALLEKYQIVHQTGEANIVEVEGRAKIALGDSPSKVHYKTFAYLNSIVMRMSAGVATLVISRAGSGSIFEVANWGIPTILIPLPEEVSHDQIKNAFSYARAGAAVVIEQNNLTSGVLLSEINRILTNKDLQGAMSEAAHAFAKVGGARTIAEALLSITLSHES